MMDRIRQIGFLRTMPDVVRVSRDWVARSVPKQRLLAVSLAAILLAVLYWGIIASDRYVSEAHVLIHRASIGGGDHGSTAEAVAEQYMLRDHLLSVDMLARLDEKLGLREHYSDWHRDPLSRMWSRNAPMEWFHEHFLSRVSVEFDPNAAVLVVKVQAYDAEKAHAIATLLVEEGERFMNSLGQRMAAEQVAFLEQQAERLAERMVRDRQAVMDFQNRKRLASPQTMSENIGGIIGRLEAQLSDLQTRRSTMQGYLMPSSSNIADIDLQIAAVEKQIVREKERLASPGGQALNRTLEEYQRLQLRAEFTTEVYKSAVTALEQGRIEAARKLMQVSVLQSPTRPQYPMEPRRIYNIVVFILMTAVLAGVVHLLNSIIRDHKD